MKTRRKVFIRSVRLRLTLRVVLIVAIALPFLPLSGCQIRSANPATQAPATTVRTTPTPAPLPTATVSPTPKPTTTATTVAATPTPAVPQNPLTGLPLGNIAAAGQRPVAIMINNIKIATPQIGIGSADLIYEMPVEGGITRLMAVFADVTAIPELGSIRSGRHDYIDLAGGLDAIYVHFGASFMANEQLGAQKTAHIDLPAFSSAYWRDPEWRAGRGYEHSVKTTGERLTAAITKAGYRMGVRSGQPAAFLFRDPSDFTAAAGMSATAVRAPFSGYCVATFAYDPATRLYSKGEFDKPHIDLATGQALQFTNVFILRTRITQVADTVLKEIDLNQGSGYYISGGCAQEIAWQKGETNDTFVFMDLAGKELSVNPGKSYLGILSDQRTITIE